MDFFRDITFFYMSLFGFSLFTVYLFVHSVVDFAFTLSLGSAQTDPKSVYHYDKSIGWFG